MKRVRIPIVPAFFRRPLRRHSDTPGPRARWRRIGLFLAILGPGMITANVDNDAGGITTYSLAGAHFGLSLLWTIIPMTVALIVTQEACARMGIVTGKGLSDLIREQYGVKTTFWVTPPLRFDRDYLQMTIGLVGTTIAPWMQFYQQAAVVEKGITSAHVEYERWDVIVGCTITDVVALFIIVACASTLYTHHIRIEDASDAARALAPLAGRHAAGLFAFGLLNASLFAASVLPLSTAFVVCEAFGWESGVSKYWSSAPQFFGLYTALIVFGAGVVLIPHFPFVAVMFLSQVVNGMVLPVVLFFMVRLATRSDLMGAFVNSRAGTIALWSTAIIMTVLTALSLLSLFGLW